ncbi:MAG TPA: tripartite tricarboxylate transporter substrate binding protein [Ramlibacter sp.]|uniref:Bug family tripartite tricarboxylate transporter substrate binding protein n=1 Tax=Ramlibacter sp. TaxID=1917967 RepID=UPI002B74888E|nr:tripartite tricarboxylate transporter substrate binding protein [Ramlibacter sp.]HVZ45206.1 tripartite tricarboxylate transporter substrate binding protein [Ramlibacter sp.]
MLKRRELVRLAALAPIAASVRPLWAQQNITKLCVPYSAGGAMDVMARIMAESMAKTLKRTVIVENKAGAAAVIGTKYVQAAPPDGATLLFHNSGYVATPLLQKAPAYDPLKDLDPVAMVGNVPNFLIVHESVPAKTVPELIAYSRTLPAGIECGNAGNNSGGHISAIMLEKLGGMKILHVPFKGGSEVATALIGGQVKMQISSQNDSLMGQIKAGKLRVLGVATSKRSDLAPDVPAISEFIPGYAIDGWYGVLAPAGTPLALRATLANAVKVAIEQPANKERLNQFYMDVGWRNPTEFGKVIASSVAYYRKMIDTLGLVPQ